MAFVRAWERVREKVQKYAFWSKESMDKNNACIHRWVLSCSFKWPVIGFSPVGVWCHGMLRSSCHNLCTWKASLPCGSGPVVSMLRSSCHNFCTCMASLPYGPSHVPSSGQDWEDLVILGAFKRLLSREGPLMFLQEASYWEDLDVLFWASKRSLGEYVEELFSQFVHLNGFSLDLEKHLSHFVPTAIATEN